MYCSSIKLDISLTGTGSWINLLDIDDVMEEELSHDWSSLAQDTEPIGADHAVVRGRGNSVQTLRFSRVKTDHGTVEAARRYLQSHAIEVPGTTVHARMIYSSDAGVPAATFSTTNAHVDSFSGLITGGSETTHRYSLRWQMGTP